MKRKNPDNREIEVNVLVCTYCCLFSILNFVLRLTRLRTGCTYLAQNTGTYQNIPRENRICPLCKQGVEDLSHFLFTRKEKIKSRIFLDDIVKAILFKPFKYGSLSAKLNIILNLKFDRQGLAKKVSKAIFHLYKERLEWKRSQK